MWLDNLWTQTKVLIWKSFLIMYRNKVSSLVLLLSPLFVCGYLQCIQIVVDSFLDDLIDPNPVTSPIGIPKCWGPDCTTLRVCLTGPPEPKTDFIISHLSANYGLKIGKDLKVAIQPPADCIQYIKDHQNTTQTAVIFCNTEFTLPQNDYLPSIPCQSEQATGYFYSLMYNFTALSGDVRAPSSVNQAVLGTKLALDNAILAYEGMRSSIEVPTITGKIQGFPVPKIRFGNNYDVVSAQGAIYFFIPPMLLFGMFIAEIAKEKEYKLRHGLIVMGLSNLAYWLSWFIVSFIISLAGSLIQIISGLLFQFIVFWNAPFL